MNSSRKLLNAQEAYHLAWRSGFGPNESANQWIGQKTRAQAVDSIFKASQANHPIELFDFSPRKEARMKDLSPEERRKRRQEKRQQLRTLAIHWVRKMATDSAQLREKMTFFWHDHFAARVDHPFGMQDFNNLMRRHATGNFRTLLLEVAQHPVMLEYLNGRQNRKAHPNENFARELMELFTLGVGNYTENDIKEAARAFTGWNFDAEGNFIIKQKQHDNGSKTFRGATGNFDGEDIIDHILADKQTARYICQKLYQYLVHPEPNAKRIEALADTFYNKNYQIEPVLRQIFLADWFYDAPQRGTHIKSPVEMLAGMQRVLPLKFPNDDGPFQILRLLGQVPFDPPNVAGWTSGTGWIDSSTLSARMSFPVLAIMGGEANFQANPDLKMTGKGNKKGKKLKGEMNWEAWESALRKVELEELATEIQNRLLPFADPGLQTKITGQEPLSPLRKVRIRQLTLSILMLPEYQLA